MGGACPHSCDLPEDPLNEGEDGPLMVEPKTKKARISDPNIAAASESPKEDVAEVESVQCKLKRIVDTILHTARHLPFVINAEHKDQWRCKLKPGITLSDVLLKCVLGKAPLQIPGGR